MKKIHFILIFLAAIAFVTFKYEWRNHISHSLITTIDSKQNKQQDSSTVFNQWVQTQTEKVHHRIDTLQQQLWQTKQQLQQERVRVMSLRNSVQQLIAKDTSTHFATRIANCDSMKIQIGILNFHGKLSDSLCDQTQLRLEDIVNQQQLELQVQGLQNKQLKEDVKAAEKQQHYLQLDNQHWQHVVQQKTITNRIWTTGALILVSAALLQLLTTRIK